MVVKLEKKKEPLAKQAALVYNLLRKYRMRNPIALSRITYRISILDFWTFGLLDGEGCLFFVCRILSEVLIKKIVMQSIIMYNKISKVFSGLIFKG